MNESKPNKYFAFISYKREDEEWAIWFHHELENYHLPNSMNGRTDLPTEFRPVFRDIDELKAGNLPEQIYNALDSSAYLVVICSPNAAKSEWVNKEIKDFIEIGKVKGIDNVRKIFPFIVDGRPHSKNKSEECFPKALLELSKNEEIVGGNVNEGNLDWCGNVNETGRDKAFVKVLAGMLPNVAFDELWNRYERDKAEVERIEREKMDNLRRMQSRVVAEKAMTIVQKDSYLARLLAVEVLPKDLGNPDRPYTADAERMLRIAFTKNNLVFNGHTDNVFSAVFSKDGKMVVSASRDNTLRIWDVYTGKTIRVLEGNSGYVRYATFSPKGDRIVSAFHDGSIVLWDVLSGRPISRLLGHSDFVTWVSFNPDGSQIVSASADKTIRIWDVNSCNEIKRINEHSETVNSVEYNPSGEFVVSSSDDRTVKCWNAKTGSLVAWAEFYYWVNHASFSPDGKQIVCSLSDATVGVWDLKSGEISSFKGHADVVHSAFFSPDGKQIVSASGDNTIIIWDAKNRTKERILHCHENSVNYAEFNCDGSKIVSASGDRSICISCGDSIESSSFVLKDSVGVYVVPNVSNDRKRLATSTLEGALRVWNLYDGSLICELCKSNCQSCASFSFNGTMVGFISKDGVLCISYLDSGIIIKRFKYSFDTFCSPVFSPNGKIVACATDDYSLVLLDLYSNKAKLMLREHTQPISLLAFSPDGNRIVSASDDNTIKVWNKDLNQSIFSLQKHTDRISSLFISSDGGILVSAANDHTVILWDLVTGEALWIVDGFSNGVGSASLNQDNTLLVSAADNTIIVWNVADKTELLSMKIQTQPIVYVCFSNDDNDIMAVSMDHSVRYLSFPPLQDLIDQTRERFKDRPLTPEERKQYYLE